MSLSNFAMVYESEYCFDEKNSKSNDDDEGYEDCQRIAVNQALRKHGTIVSNHEKFHDDNISPL